MDQTGIFLLYSYSLFWVPYPVVPNPFPSYMGVGPNYCSQNVVGIRIHNLNRTFKDNLHMVVDGPSLLADGVLQESLCS